MSWKEFQVGDIITAYHKGYHIVTAVARCLSYTRVDGNRRTQNSCDHLWCKKVDIDELHKKLVAEADALRDALLKARESL